MEFEVGQKLFCVENNWRRKASYKYIKIQKIGRKWLTMEDGDRVDKNTMYIDGGKFSSPGRAYMSEEDYQLETQKNEAWEKLRSLIRSRCTPEHLKIKHIEFMVNLINGNTEKKEIKQP